jgi:hypothetical protein
MFYNFPSIVRLKHAVIFIFTIIAMDCNAQFIKGIGIMGGLNMSNQRWQIDTTDYNKNQKFKFGFNGSLFSTAYFTMLLRSISLSISLNLSNGRVNGELFESLKESTAFK